MFFSYFFFSFFHVSIVMESWEMDTSKTSFIYPLASFFASLIAG